MLDTILDQGARFGAWLVKFDVWHVALAVVVVVVLLIYSETDRDPPWQR